MNKTALSETKKLVLGWYEKHPDLFDQEDNRELFRYYLEKFLGLKLNPVAEMRLEKYSWSTIERSARLLVAQNKIEISMENREARHLEAEKTKKAVKEKINYDEMYEFVGGVARLKQ